MKKNNPPCRTILISTFFFSFTSARCDCKRMRRGDVSAPDPWGPLIRHHQKSRSFRLGYEIFFHTNWLTLSSYISHLVLWRWLSLSLDRIVVVLVLFILVSSRRRRLYMCGSITSFIYTYVSVPLFFLFFCSLIFPISGICSPEENEPTPSAGSLIFCDVSVGTYSSHSHLSWYTFCLSKKKISWWKNPKRHIIAILISLYFPIPLLHIPLPGNSDKLFRQMIQRGFSMLLKKKRKWKGIYH